MTISGPGEWYARWPNFSPEELACKHCGALPDPLDTEFLDKLQSMRSLLGPLRVNSGHRCRTHNLAVGGAAYSQHKALAVDIHLPKDRELDFYNTALQLGFLGIGLGSSFIHLDMRRKIDGHQPPRKLTIFYYPGTKAKWDKILKKGQETNGLA